MHSPICNIWRKSRAGPFDSIWEHMQPPLLWAVLRTITWETIKYRDANITINNNFRPERESRAVGRGGGGWGGQLPPQDFQHWNGHTKSYKMAQTRGFYLNLLQSYASFYHYLFLLDFTFVISLNQNLLKWPKINKNIVLILKY